MHIHGDVAMGFMNGVSHARHRCTRAITIEQSQRHCKLLNLR